MTGDPYSDDPEKELEAMRDAVRQLAQTRKNVKPEPESDEEVDVASEAVDETEGKGSGDAQAVDEAVSVGAADDGSMDERLADALRRAEAVLFASDIPLDAATLTKALPVGVESGDVLVALRERYRHRGVQLVEIGGKWRFQTAPDLAFLFEETREQPRQLSRAAKETLAIIAYCQPVSRAEIEDVRGVAVSKGTLDVLMEVGWIKPRGRRKTPGRPLTYGVSEEFLVHFGLDSLDSLPGREELRSAGLLSASIPKDFEMPGTPRDPETGEILNEEPLEEPEFQQDFFEGQEDRE